MRITEAEKQFIALHRERIKLDSTDWSKEPFVTAKQLHEMSPWKAFPLLSDPCFRYCIYRDVLVNMRKDLGADDVRASEALPEPPLCRSEVPHIPQG